MLSPAIFRVCCLAVMAPALTKAVRQADGLTHLLMPQKNFAFVASKIDQLCSNDRTAAALNGPGKPPRAYKGGSVNNGTKLSNGDLLHYKAFTCNQPHGNIKRISANGLKSAILSGTSNLGSKPAGRLNGHGFSDAGGSSPSYGSGEFLNKMNEDVSGTEDRMGLLNANTSLDFHAKSYNHQCVSPVSLNMSPSGSEFIKDIPTKSPEESILSPLGSPKSASGESTSTVTTHNPQVVTFAELEEARQCHRSFELRSKELMLRLRKLQLLQLDRHVVSQLKALVGHYQKTLSIPCQRQVRQNGSRRSKEPVDFKAGLLQSENVRSLSTAALVNLVRSIESSSSSSKYLMSNRTTMSEIEESLMSERGNVKLNPEECEQIKQVTGSLLMRVNHLESAMDSDATESSSGGESCDESEEYDNKKTNSTPLFKKAGWTWAIDRAPIARRWTWLQAQVQDLEYKIRLIGDLLLQARKAKGEVCFEDPVQSDSTSPGRAASSSEDHSVSVKKTLRSVNGYLDHAAIINDDGLNAICGVPPTPPSSEPCSSSAASEQSSASNVDDCGSVSRTRPRVITNFRKRKLVRTPGLHLYHKKSARLATVKCNCNSRLDIMPCILCGGRYNSTQNIDPNVMPLLERIALLQPTFHPMLSLEKDVSVSLHFENHLRKSETYYSIPKPGPSSPIKKQQFGLKPRGILDHARHHSRKLAKHAAQTLLSSERYKNSRHMSDRSSKLHSQGIAFKKWKKMHKGTFKNKHYKSWSVASGCSSRQDSPVHSPSAFEDGILLNSLSGKENSLHEIIKKRRDEHHFDIDNVVIPYNMKTASSFQKLQYKEIITPKWRYFDENFENGPVSNEDDKVIEDISDEAVAKRHDRMEIEERKHLRFGSSHLGLGGSRRGRKSFRYDSRADSSGANTPDHLSYYHQDIMFQDSNSFISGGPSSPVLSPPATPGSVNATSDDSQPSGSHAPSTSSERKRTTSTGSTSKRERSSDDGAHAQEDVVHQPFEPRTFPLPDKEWEEMVRESEQAEASLEQMESEPCVNEPSSPGSMESSSSTSSAFEDEGDDVADPEWTVVRRQNGPDRTLVIKLAKR